MFEFFEHTADLGLRVRARTLDDLFRDAADGLFAMIVREVPASPGAPRRKLRIESEQLDWLLVDWLRELLWLAESERVLLRDFVVRVDREACRLEAEASCVPFEHAREPPLHEVKAITYHGLRIEHDAGGWLGEVIVDI